MFGIDGLIPAEPARDGVQGGFHQRMQAIGGGAVARAGPSVDGRAALGPRRDRTLWRCEVKGLGRKRRGTGQGGSSDTEENHVMKRRLPELVAVRYLSSAASVDVTIVRT